MVRTETSRINGSLPPLSASTQLRRLHSKRKRNRLLVRPSYVNLKRNGGYRATSKPSNEISNSRKSKLRNRSRRSGTCRLSKCLSLRMAVSKWWLSLKSKKRFWAPTTLRILLTTVSITKIHVGMSVPFVTSSTALASLSDDLLLYYFNLITFQK